MSTYRILPKDCLIELWGHCYLSRRVAEALSTNDTLQRCQPYLYIWPT